MDANPSPAAWHRPLQLTIYLLCITLIGAILYFAKEVLIPVALAILITFTLSPLVTRLDKMGVRRVASVLIVVITAGLLICGILLFVGIELKAIAEDVPTYRETIKEKVASLREMGKGGVFDRLLATAQDIAQEVKQEDPNGPKKDGLPVPAKATEPVAVKVVGEEGPEKALRDAIGPYLILSPLLEPLATIGLALILVIFMLIKREDMRNRLVSFASVGSLTVTTRALDDAGRRISRYLLMQMFINGSFGLSVGIGLFLLGVPYALLWGLCAGILRYIPYIGPWVAATLPISVSLITSPGWTQLFLVLGLFLLLELISNNVLEPWLYGAGMGVSEVALIVSAAIWAWLWGPLGLILSAPLTVCVLVLGRYVPALGFLEKLLGDEPTLDAPATFLQRLLARDRHEAKVIVETYCREHAPEGVYDDLFVPALALAREERSRGVMTPADEAAVLDGVRTALIELPAAAASPAAPGGIVVFGCPAHHEIEELTLVMLDQLLRPSGFPTRLISTKTLPSEVLAEVKRDQPPVIFIAAVPPGGLVQAFYLCKRLRKRAPKALLIVGYLGYGRNLDKIIAKMRGAGANYVTTTLQGTRAHLLPLLKAPPVEAVGAR